MSTNPTIHPPSVLRNARQAGLTIVELFDSLPWFKPEGDWIAWRAFLCAAYGLPMSDEEFSIYQAHTGREEAPDEECAIIELICGRRAGKTRIDSVIIGYEACYRDYTPYLAPGERAYFPIISADRKGARSSANYIKAFLASIALEGMVSEKEIEKAATLNWQANFLEDPVTIEIFTASYKATRGYAIPAFLGDEIAFWSTNQDAAAPDTEIVKAVRGGMVQIPNAKTLYLSSPHGETGVLYDTYARFYGAEKEADARKHRALVWKAPTTAMNRNPIVAVSIAEAYELDDVDADAEYGANFKPSETEYISMAVLMALTDKGVKERKPVTPRHGSAREHRINYFAFMDPASGSGRDSMTLAIAHWDYDVDPYVGRAVLDLVWERRPPFDPHAAVRKICGLAKPFGIAYITGDAWGDWPREIFGDEGMAYTVSERTKSEIYKAVIPAFNARLMILLDDKRMRNQFHGLQRKPGDRGREIIDHKKGEHDDVANAAAGALLQAYDEGRHFLSTETPKDEPTTVKEVWQREVEKMQESARVGQEPEPDEWET